MSSQTTNSARRLHAILQRASKYSKDQSLVDAWACILEVDTSEVNQKLDKILILCQEIREDIRSINVNNSEKYLNIINEIRYFLVRYSLSNSSNRDWQNVRFRIEQRWLDLVDAIADFIDLKGGNFLEIHPDELNILQKQVRELIDEVKTIKLDSETKTFLIKQLRKMEESLLDYHIRGSVGVEKVEKEVLGRIISEVVQNEKLQNAKDIVGKILKYSVSQNDEVQ